MPTLNQTHPCSSACCMSHLLCRSRHGRRSQRMLSHYMYRAYPGPNPLIAREPRFPHTLNVQIWDQRSLQKYSNALNSAYGMLRSSGTMRRLSILSAHMPRSLKEMLLTFRSLALSCHDDEQIRFDRWT